MTLSLCVCNVYTCTVKTASGLAVGVKVVRFVLFFFDFSFRMTYRFTFALVYLLLLLFYACVIYYVVIMCTVYRREVLASTAVVRLRRSIVGDVYRI